MKILALMITSFLFWNVCTAEIITRTFRWTNFEDFLAAGWVPNNNETNRWQSPVDLDSKLKNLNNNFTDEVWGLRSTTNNLFNYFNLYWSSSPEYCGIINATFEVKVYFSGNETRNFVGHPKLLLNSTELVEWQTVSTEINIPEGRAYVQYYLLVGELFIFDEVSLTYSAQQNDANCPHSCNHDCEYRAIDCHHYYTCVDRKYKEIHSCSKDQGLAFNPITKTCDLLENVEGCHSSPEICVCTYRPHETNCSSYYFCNNTCHPEECEERHCPSGLTWSTDALGDGSGLQQCVPSANATCQNETRPKSKTTATQFVVLPQLEDIRNDLSESARARV